MFIKIGQPIMPATTLADRPVPPRELMEYSEQSDVHLTYGKSEYDQMKTAISTSGHNLTAAQKVLDFGCNNGRILRWFEDYNNREIWGCDLQADKVLWALENLSPLRFLVNSPTPHLPFADSYFDLIYAMSIFTHIKESHIAWLLELCRLVNRGGLLYITLHDRDTLDPEKAPRAKILLDNHFLGLSDVGSTLEDIGYLAMNYYSNNNLAQVYISKEYLGRILPPYMKIITQIPRAYSDLQTAYVIKRVM